MEDAGSCSGAYAAELALDTDVAGGADFGRAAALTAVNDVDDDDGSFVGFLLRSARALRGTCGALPTRKGCCNALAVVLGADFLRRRVGSGGCCSCSFCRGGTFSEFAEEVFVLFGFVALAAAVALVVVVVGGSNAGVGSVTAFICCGCVLGLSTAFGMTFASAAMISRTSLISLSSPLTMRAALMCARSVCRMDVCSSSRTSLTLCLRCSSVFGFLCALFNFLPTSASKEARSAEVVEMTETTSSEVAHATSARPAAHNKRLQLLTMVGIKNNPIGGALDDDDMTGAPLDEDKAPLDDNVDEDGGKCSVGFKQFRMDEGGVVVKWSVDHDK